MIKTSTLTTTSLNNSPETGNKKQEEIQLPEFAEPSAACVNSILNFSKSLKVLKSSFIDSVEIVHS